MMIIVLSWQEGESTHTHILYRRCSFLLNTPKLFYSGPALAPYYDKPTWHLTDTQHSSGLTQLSRVWRHTTARLSRAHTVTGDSAGTELGSHETLRQEAQPYTIQKHELGIGYNDELTRTHHVQNVVVLPYEPVSAAPR